jgi:hypothetical protein
LEIHQHLSLAEVAAIVSSTLEQAGITAVLSGGSVVTIYSENEYESLDLDFVSPAAKSRLVEVLQSLGFREEGRHLTHPDTEYLLDFPSSPLEIGGEVVDYADCAILEMSTGRLAILTPTQCVMDRLASFYFWNDMQCLDQAVMVAKRQPINSSEIEAWSRRQGYLKKYQEFFDALNS